MSPDTVADPSELAEPRPRSARSARLRIILIVVALVLLVVAAIWLTRYLSFGRYQEKTNDAYLQADAITVAPKVSGSVERVFVQDNQVVKAGQPLVPAWAKASPAAH